MPQMQNLELYIHTVRGNDSVLILYIYPVTKKDESLILVVGLQTCSPGLHTLQGGIFFPLSSADPLHRESFMMFDSLLLQLPQHISWVCRWR